MTRLTALFRLLIATALITTASTALAEYTLQLQVDPALEASMERITGLSKVHAATFGPGEHFVYLGHFASIDAAEAKLAQIKRDVEPQLQSYRPLIVEIFLPPSARKAIEQQAPKASVPPSAPLQPGATPTAVKRTATVATPVIAPASLARQKKVEADELPTSLQADLPKQHTALDSRAPLAAAVAADYETQTPAQAATPEASGNIIYSVQLAEFDRQQDLQWFLEDHPSGEFLCYHNGAATRVYLERFSNRIDAQDFIREAGSFGELTPRIIELDAALLSACR